MNQQQGEVQVRRKGVQLLSPHLPTENNACNSKTDSVKVRTEIDQMIRDLGRMVIRLRRLKEVV
jgi:hypothetical protein